MRKLIVTTWVSFDGYIAGPNGEMDFVTSIYDEAMGEYENNLVAGADLLVLGRVTYDSFAGAWPRVPDSPQASEGEKEYARKLNKMRKVVFSNKMKKADWENSVVLHEIVREDIQKLKQEPGKDILVYGSCSIVQQLTNLNLVDEYQLLVHPVVLGGGKRLFDNIQHRLNLKLVKTNVHPSGVVMLCYQSV